jgi:two-component system nitrogen regulation response regulator NtrX
MVVDDDILFRQEVVHILRKRDLSTRELGSVAECRSELRKAHPSVLLLDIQLPDGSGIVLLREIMASTRVPEVVIISGAASLQQAADSIKLGACDFLEKPFEPARLISVVENCLKIAHLKEQNTRLLADKLERYRIVGQSPAIRHVTEQIQQTARTDARVLITGETGVGKELVAGQLHFLGRRAAAPFVTVNCSALPSELIESELFGHVKGAFTGAVRDRDGRFKSADGGTLLLDEIGDMPIGLQPKLLRAIESGEIEPLGSSTSTAVDVRIMASTNQKVEQLAQAGRFRSDLFFRLNTIPIDVPPLRSRRDDIPLLASHFLSKLTSSEALDPKQMSIEALDTLVAFDWPGNVRQLRNAIERLNYMSQSDTISASEVRDCLGSAPDDVQVSDSNGSNRLADAVHGFEKRFLKLELETAGGNIARLAEQLGMDRGNLYRKLKKLGLLSE